LFGSVHVHLTMLVRIYRLSLPAVSVWMGFPGCVHKLPAILKCRTIMLSLLSACMHSLAFDSNTVQHEIVCNFELHGREMAGMQVIAEAAAVATATAEVSLSMQRHLKQCGNSEFAHLQLQRQCELTVTGSWAETEPAPLVPETDMRIFPDTVRKGRLRYEQHSNRRLVLHVATAWTDCDAAWSMKFQSCTQNGL
jgi:hypothetical protein